MNLGLFVPPSVYPPILMPAHSSNHSQCKILELSIPFFLIYCMKLDSHKVRKVTKNEFSKNVHLSQEGPKRTKIGKK